MSKDISTLLEGWDYHPDRINARWVTGVDGLPKVQLRLDLGVLQMEMEGRPDGTTPRGYPSLLDYYQSLEEQFTPDHPGLRLNEASCSALQQEAVQYYYRYLAFHALGHLDGVIRDTEHNLDIFDLVAAHALDDEVAWQFLQFFPYVRMMNARALAEKAMETQDFEDAMFALQEAYDDIESFGGEYNDFEEEAPFEELEVLRTMLDRIKAKKPKSQVDQLKEDLDRAIASEDYERAAILRDSLLKIRTRGQGVVHDDH